MAVDAYGVFTNNPPCGAMRGFGCVQAAFAYEALMDELADAVGLDRVEIRQLNGMREGDRNITGQVIDSAAPVAELLQIVQDMPLPPARRTPRTSARCPGRSATPPTARAWSGASATPSPTRTSASPRASTTTRPPASGWR